MLAVLGLCAALLAAASYLILVVDTVRGGIAPNPVTWFFGALLSFTALDSQWRLGASWSLGMTAVQTIGCVALVGLSLRGGLRFTSFDAGMFAVTAAVLVARTCLDDPSVALSLSIMADGLAMLPTLRDTHRTPDDVGLRPWVMNAVSGAFGAVSVGALDPALMAYPVYLLVISLAVVVAERLGQAQVHHDVVASTDPVPWLVGAPASATVTAWVPVPRASPEWLSVRTI